MAKNRINQVLVNYDFYQDKQFSPVYSFRYTNTRNNSLFNILLSSNRNGNKTKEYIYQHDNMNTFFFGIQSDIVNYDKTYALNVKMNSGFNCYMDWLDEFKSVYHYNNPKYIVKLDVIKCILELSKYKEDNNCKLYVYYKDELMFDNVPMKSYNFYWKTVRFIKDNFNLFVESGS